MLTSVFLALVAILLCEARNMGLSTNHVFNSIDNGNYKPNELKSVWAVNKMFPVCKGNRCTCKPGYQLHGSGKLCEPVCDGGCENGYCHLPNTCVCYDGYVKVSPFSNACVAHCSQGCHGGNCIAPEVCVCKPGYVRSPLTLDCLPLCKERCENGYCFEPNKCKCNPGYKRLEGSQKCVPKCTGGCKNGICTLPETCLCKPGYKKDQADPNKCVPKCAPACVNGECVAPNQCFCHEAYVKDPNVLTANVCVHINLINRFNNLRHQY